MPMAISMEKSSQNGPEAPSSGQGKRVKQKQCLRVKRRHAEEVSLNSRSPKPSFAEKVCSEVLLIQPGAFRHGRFAVQLPKGESAIPG